MRKIKYITFECQKCGYQFTATTNRFIRIMAGHKILAIPDLYCEGCFCKLAWQIEGKVRNL